jgi:hypothetical protein
MSPFNENEIMKVLNHLIKESETNINNEVSKQKITNNFPYSRNEQRINKPRFNLIKRFHVPTNYSIEIEFMPDCAGRAKWVGKRIILNDVLNDIESIKTLTHEWGHMRMHLKNNAVKLDHEIKEIEAESVAFIIITLLGLLDDGNKDNNIINQSLQYIIRYTKQSGKSIDEIMKTSKKRIFTAVNHILNKYLINVY